MRYERKKDKKLDENDDRMPGELRQIQMYTVYSVQYIYTKRVCIYISNAILVHKEGRLCHMRLRSYLSIYGSKPVHTTVSTQPAIGIWTRKSC